MAAIIAFVSEKGGVGKSTCVEGLAWELLARRSKVLIADADWNSQTCRAGCKRAKTEGHRPPAIVAVDEDMFEEDNLPHMARDYDFVVIDTPAGEEKLRRAALAVAHLVVMPVSQSGEELRANTRTIGQIREMHHIRPDLRSAVVFTRTFPRTALYKGLRESVATLVSPMKVLRASASNSILWQEALVLGRGITHFAKPATTPHKEMKAIVDELLGMLPSTKELRKVSNG